MLSRLLFLGSLVLFGFSLGAIKDNEAAPMLIINMANESVLPSNFRTAQDSFLNKTTNLPSREGLDDLKTSGSSQFSEKSFVVLLKRLNQPTVTVIDLREESHGFINGSAVGWYGPRDWINIGKNLNQIEAEEQILLNNSQRQKKVVVHKIEKKDLEGLLLPKTTSFIAEVLVALTEKDLLKNYDVNYVRIPVTDHLHPSNEAVDLFLSYINSPSSKNWTHFHCSAGLGRTTTFMIMFDMIQNAENVSFEDILKRQWLLGGSNLQKTNVKYEWKIPHAQARIEFLKKFYDYCKYRYRYSGLSWTDYLSQFKLENPL